MNFLTIRRSLAPTAMRTAISLVRWPTANDTTA
jgi:hypothetical protein